MLQDADRGELKPFYNFIGDLPHLEGQPLPDPNRGYLHHILGRVSSFDAGHGCPFSCSFCTIVNVQGRKSRYRDADDIERLVGVNQVQGSTSYFTTDDDFARNKNWEAILDRLIELREQEGIEIRPTIQVDVLCHKIPRFVEKAARAGCKRVFIGLESTNPDNLKAASKRPNRVAEYRAMRQAWRRVGAITYAGYILGFSDDTPEKIRRDIRVIQRELPIDILEFFVLNGCYLTLLVDRFITVRAASVRVENIEYDGGDLRVAGFSITFGSIDNQRFCLTLRSDASNIVVLTSSGRSLTLGPRINPVDPSGRPDIYFVPERGDELSLTVSRSVLS